MFDTVGLNCRKLITGINIMRLCMAMLCSLTWILLALFKGLVDINQGEVVSLWVLELHIALGRLWFQLHRRNHEARWH